MPLRAKFASEHSFLYMLRLLRPPQFLRVIWMMWWELLRKFSVPSRGRAPTARSEGAVDRRADGVAFALPPSNSRRLLLPWDRKVASSSSDGSTSAEHTPEATSSSPRSTRS